MIRRLLVLAALAAGFVVLGGAAHAHDDSSVHDARDRISDVRDAYDDAVDDVKDAWRDDRDEITDRGSWPSMADGAELTARARTYAADRVALAARYHADLQAAWAAWAEAKRGVVGG